MGLFGKQSSKPDKYYEPGNNRVIGCDGQGNLLVEADSAWAITGDDRYEQNMHVEKIGRRRYVVSFGGCWQNGHIVHGKFYRARGQVVPRKKGDLIMEAMVGYHHEGAHVEILEKIPDQNHERGSHDYFYEEHP